MFGSRRQSTRKHKHKGNDLERPRLKWTRDDFFTKRDLLRSVWIEGATGSGKTSFVGDRKEASDVWIETPE